jgi:hypothetical protein
VWVRVCLVVVIAAAAAVVEVVGERSLCWMECVHRCTGVYSQSSERRRAVAQRTGQMMRLGMWAYDIRGS